MPDKDVRMIMGRIMKAGYGEAYPGRGRGSRPSWRDDPFHVLVATVLSQRTRDKNTAIASERLFSELNTPQEISEAPLQTLEALIRPAGFPQAKAKAIKEIARLIQQEHGGKVPRDIEVLISFPLVGRKTANCVLAYAFGEDAICVDTHVHRISNRIGLVRTKNPDQTEKALREAVPRDLWISINRLLVVFGQKICRPRNPLCEECPVNDQCDYYRSLELERA